jgi:vesicle coat complex subunit
VLKLATDEADNPDLRDRAYIYWRMLSISPANTKYVVLGEKPNISDDSYNTYDDSLVTTLID